MPVTYNSFSPASLVILSMSSDEELVIVEAVEEFDPGFLLFTGGVMMTFT